MGFTQLSQQISPGELVEGLVRIFPVFDALVEKHGVEKIKTIGDAYIAVCGVPIPRNDHGCVMANMALDMMKAMCQYASDTTGEKIQIRIGIHSGEEVCPQLVG